MNMPVHKVPKYIVKLGDEVIYEGSDEAAVHGHVDRLTEEHKDRFVDVYAHAGAFRKRTEGGNADG